MPISISEIYGINIYWAQVHVYSNKSIPSKQPTKLARTSANILGLNRQQTSEQPRVSIETEIDQYLTDPGQGAGILEFWQVIVFLQLFCSFFN